MQTKKCFVGRCGAEVDRDRAVLLEIAERAGFSEIVERLKKK